MKLLLKQVRSCTHCADYLPCGPRPVVQASPSARILIIGQAPGAKVHKSGVPWKDASGNRLREWLDLEDDCFYDPERVALVPMGFCYPGKGKSGDLPPRPECRELWHQPILDALTRIKLTILIGRYAQDSYLDTNAATLTDTVKNFETHLPAKFPLPHPSPRNQFWLTRNPWFETDVLPELKKRVKDALQDTKKAKP